MRQPHLEGIYVMESLNGHLVVLSFKLVTLPHCGYLYAMIFKNVAPSIWRSPKIENQWLV